jgi:voltage-gated potassium channel
MVPQSKKMQKIHAKNNFIFFTVALVCVLLASAVVSSTPAGENYRLIQAVLMLTQVVAYFSLNLSKKWRGFVGLMLALMLVSNVVRELTNWPQLPEVGLLLMLIFYCGMTYAAARQAFFSGSIDHNIIVGTVAIFLLLGLIWAIMYLITLEYWPQGFIGLEYRNWHDNLGTAVYFSFITMTSTGYGDIIPVLPVTRTLAYMQAITGTFYMAVVVANLVGAYSRAAKQ